MHAQSFSLPKIGIILAVLVAALFATVASPAYAVAAAVTDVAPSSGSTAGGTVVTVTGTGFTGATGATFGGVPGTSFVVNNDTQITVTSPAHDAGAVGITVLDPDGNSPDSADDDFTYVAPPAITNLSPDEGPTTGGTVVTITGTNLTGTTQVSFGGTNVVPSNVTSTTLQATSPAHAAGTVDVSVTNSIGTSANTSADNFTYNAAGPVVTNVSPPGGPIGGGTVVTLTGTGFTGATSVTFGGTTGTALTVNSDTSITVTAPAHAAGSVAVLVTTGVGTSPNTAADDYLYGAAGPTITALSPTAGPIIGGTVVTITGTGFTGATAVTFDGTAGTSLTVNSSTSITITSPAHAAGAVDVQVTTPFGSSANTSADNFTYTAAPVITSVSPFGGPIAGGTVVTISGTGFTGALSVTFGGTAATSFTVNSNSQITATAPAHTAGSVDVVVTSALGTSANSTADDYVYGSGPVITSINPGAGSTAGGTTVTITGTGFTGATAVMFGSVAAASFNVVSDSQMTAVSPAQANSVVGISVVTPLGTSANTVADDFTYGTGSTTSFTLYFRWTLIVWNGKDLADITNALKGQENPDNPNTNDISGVVTAIFHYNNPQQKFEGFFPGSAGIPGANDFTTFKKGEAYWIAMSSAGSLTWTTLAD